MLIYETPRYIRETPIVIREEKKKRLINCKEITGDGRVPGFEHRHAVGLLVSRSRSYRIFACIKEHNGKKIICLLTSIERSKAEEYREITKNPSKANELISQLETTEAKKQFDTLTTEHPTDPRPSLPEHLLRWITPSQELDHGHPVLEFEPWYTNSRRSDISRKEFEQIMEQVIRTADAKYDEAIVHLLSADAGDWKAEFVATTWRKKRLLLLVDLSKRTPHTENKNPLIFEKIKAALTSNDESQWDELARHANASYPEYALYDPDALDLIRRGSDNGLGLALSTEELESLQRILRGERPLLIQGGAGSGKTTVLLYTLFQFLTTKEPFHTEFTDILYVTHNKNLLDRAKNAADTLLNAFKRLYDVTHSNRFSPHRVKYTTFENLLLSWLGSDASDLQGPCIDAAKFRILYENSFGRSHDVKTSADLAWYIIRSFIKGRAEEITPSEYNNLPRGDRTVKPSDFKYVYDHVWSNWYKKYTLSGGGEHWDAQDLARKVLEKPERLSDSFPAILCDEGQDFTQIETELLLACLPYRDYNLQNQSKPYAIPVIVAADPFQSVNPSGFRWEHAKAALEEALFEDHFDRKEFRVNQQILEYNYRNNLHLAQLANLVQYARLGLFDLKVTPQLPWEQSSQDKNCGNIVFIPITDNNLEELGEILRQDAGLVIVPNDDPRNNAVIQRLLNLKNDKDNLLPKLETSVTVKGLEYPDITLIGAGEEYVNRFGTDPKKNPLRNGNKDLEENYDLQFFLNFLYVAQTRAKHQLILVDTSRGLSEFWEPLWEFACLRQNDISNSWKLCLPHFSINSWKDAFRVEFSENLELIRIKDPLKLAELYLKEAQKYNDSAKYKRAADFFSRGGRVLDASSALADAYEVEGSILKAAEIDKEIGRPIRGFDRLWKAGQLVDAAKFHADFSTIFPPVEDNRYTICDYVTDLHKETINVERIHEIVIYFQQNIAHISNNTIIRDVCTKAFLKAAIKANISKDQAYVWLGIVDSLIGRTPPQRFLIDIGFLAFKAQEWIRAERSWKEAKYTDHPSYHEAAAQILSYPENLPHWESANQLSHVYKLFVDHERDVSLIRKRDDLRRILRALEHNILEDQESKIANLNDLKSILEIILRLDAKNVSLSDKIWLKISSNHLNLDEIHRLLNSTRNSTTTHDAESFRATVEALCLNLTKSSAPEYVCNLLNDDVIQLLKPKIVVLILQRASTPTGFEICANKLLDLIASGNINWMKEILDLPSYELAALVSQKMIESVSDLRPGFAGRRGVVFLRRVSTAVLTLLSSPDIEKITSPNELARVTAKIVQWLSLTWEDPQRWNDFYKLLSTIGHKIVDGVDIEGTCQPPWNKVDFTWIRYIVTHLLDLNKTYHVFPDEKDMLKQLRERLDAWPATATPHIPHQEPASQHNGPAGDTENDHISAIYLPPGQAIETEDTTIRVIKDGKRVRVEWLTEEQQVSLDLEQASVEVENGLTKIIDGNKCIVHSPDNSWQLIVFFDHPGSAIISLSPKQHYRVGKAL